MQLSLAIICLAVICVLLILFLVAVVFIYLKVLLNVLPKLDSSQIDTRILPKINLNPFSLKKSSDQYTPDDAVGQDVSLDQFTPDPKKPLKVVYKDDEDGHGLEEVEDGDER